jgi:hypothetical protein
VDKRLAAAEARLVAVVLAAAQRGSWQAAAWALERTAPASWARPARQREVVPPAPPAADGLWAELDELAERTRGQVMTDDPNAHLRRLASKGRTRTTALARPPELAAGLGHVTAQTCRRSFTSLTARHVPDPAEAASMTGHGPDTWIRHYVGRFGPEARAEARRRLLDAGLRVGPLP